MEDQEEQLVDLGDSAEVLLQTPAFIQVIDQCVEASFATFCNTEAIKVDQRELAHRHYLAIKDVVNTLKQRVQVRDSIIEHRNGDNSQEEIAL